MMINMLIGLSHRAAAKRRRRPMSTDQVSEERVGRVRSELHGPVLKIIIDNAAKRNAFSPR